MSRETTLVSRFFVRPRAKRFLAIRAHPQKRRKWLDKLSHSPGLDSRYVRWLSKDADVLKHLRRHGAPDECFVISASPELDGAVMDVETALARVMALGYGAVIACIPDRLAYYYGELGERHALLCIDGTSGRNTPV
ncbi:MAG: hypothetical protein DRI90_15740 [Deltaproteobacteria bacterium]|nr:MAG: hypothetical protein DRI90_15740 [Deltaproteobacteria bacterium]